MPIPGTTKLHRPQEHLGGAAHELTPGDLGEIEAAASQITVQGAVIRRARSRWAKMTKEELSGVAGQMIRIKGEQPIFAEQTKEELKGVAAAMQTQKKALEEMLALRQKVGTVAMEGRQLSRDITAR